MACKIISNGRSNYSVLVPKTRDVFVDFAVKTLVDAIEKSTGVRLETTHEIGSKRFISIGETEAKRSADIKVSYGRDGYKAVEKDGNVYLFGEGIYGPIWAVYGLLEEKIGYRFFAKDEIRIEKREEIDVEGLDLEYTPSIPNRCSGFGLAKFDLEYATGLKAYAWYGQRLDGKSIWGAWAHNHVNTVLPPKMYYKDHPEWYIQIERFKKDDPEEMIPDKMQLCFSNMEMREEFFKRLIEIIIENDHATHFCIGHEDHGEYCKCENCQKMAKKLTQSGLHFDFINDMARRVEAWRKQNAPERVIMIGGLAYDPGLSFAPPVKMVDGKWVPIAPELKAGDNVFMFFAPISAPEHSRPVTDEVNKPITVIMDKWRVLCNHFGVQTYYGSFRRALEFVDGIYRFKPEIEYYKSVGVDSFYMEAPSYKGSIAFQAMSLYVLTRLEWDTTLDTDDLIKEFCDNYYKEASPYVMKYFYYFMDYYNKVRERTKYLTGEEFRYGMCLTDTVPQGFWSLNAVYDASVMLDEADKAIDEADCDQEEKQKLHDRIEIERMTLLHIQLEYFNRETCNYDELRSVNTYPKEKILELCDRMEKDVKKFGLVRLNGDSPDPIETINGWRKRAENAHRFWETRIRESRKRFNELG